ncbi:NUDIX pyrophosphatase [Balneola sp. MJW-20]|uniref:NUDIX hydrolase n=1 Tax=Gracilimonas aurantiaca TaxID=3234185 RepID=UPI003467945A
MKKLIDVYPYRITENGVKFLVFLRSKKKIYADQWRMIGGKVDENESYWKAALRELNEETGLVPDHFWVVPSVNTFYEAASDMIHHIPAFAAQIPANEEIQLNEEHTSYKWISADEVQLYLRWPEQQRLIRLIQTILEDPSNRLLPEWEIAL